MVFVFVVLNWEFRMGFPSFLAFLLVVSHLLLLHSCACPDAFHCGTLGQLKFPFAAHPRCGVFTVDCVGPVPKINLGVEGEWYQVDGPLHDGKPIKIKNLEFKSRKDCNLPSYLPNTPSVSFTISPNLTLFKCNTTDDDDLGSAEKYFFGNQTYRGCEGYVYFAHPKQQVQVPTPGSYPSNCIAIQLPAVSLIENQFTFDLFSVLASEFSLRFNVSEECRKCYIKGGQCLPNTKRVQCSIEKEGKSHLALILATVVPGIALILSLLFCIIMKKLTRSESTFCWKNKTENHRNIEAFLKNCGSLSPRRYTYSEVKKMTNSFRVKLGQGGYGCVFKGKLENGCLVAVKVLKGLKENGEEFINEVATISRTSHVNVVNLLGFCFEGRHRTLIYEFMPNGSLDKFIHDGNSSTYRQLGWEPLYRIAVGIARGLEYLHRGCNTRILHFDIKPHNILLDEDFCPKISDFGLAKLCPRKESIISLLDARGTFGYIAPEVFSRHFGGVSHKSDAYSYGMMVLEMVGGRKNVSVEVDHTSEIYFPHWIYNRIELGEELGLHGIMGYEANESAKKMIIVGLWCIQTDPSHRPSMSRVVEMLEGSLMSLPIPPKPFLTSPSRSPPADSSATLNVITE